MLTKRAALSESQQGGLSRRPLSLSGLKAGVSRGISMNSKNQSIVVQDIEIHLFSHNEEDYISLTDMVSGFEGGSSLIEAWLRNKNTIEFIGVWERINNPNFNSPEFEGIRIQAGLNRFTMSAKLWAQRTNAVF